MCIRVVVYIIVCILHVVDIEAQLVGMLDYCKYTGCCKLEMNSSHVVTVLL